MLDSCQTHTCACTCIRKHIHIIFAGHILSPANARLWFSKRFFISILLFLNNLLSFKEADGESWGAPSIWALIEGKTDKCRDKDKKFGSCVSVCVYVCVYSCLVTQ